MGLRFRRSIGLAKGVRLNVNKGGLGISAGVPGARIGAAQEENTLRWVFPALASMQ